MSLELYFDAGILDAISGRGHHNWFEQQHFVAKAELARWLKQPVELSKLSSTCSCYFGCVLPGEPLDQDQTQVLRMGWLWDGDTVDTADLK